MAIQHDKTSVAFTEFKMAPCEDWSDWSQFHCAFNEMFGYISDMYNLVEMSTQKYRIMTAEKYRDQKLAF